MERQNPFGVVRSVEDERQRIAKDPPASAYVGRTMTLSQQDVGNLVRIALMKAAPRVSER